MPPKIAKPKYEIAEKDVQVFQDRPLGRGGFGQVFMGRWSGREVAVKVLLCNLSGDVEEAFRKEIEVMLDLRSPQVIGVYGAVLKGPHQAMVVELMPKGDLYHLLRNTKDLPWDIKYRIGLDIAYGLKYLHDHSIIHRDLKSLNVLLDDRLNAKISDFGLAKVKTISASTSSNQGGIGTLLWMAPELFSRKAVTSVSSDIYALGMTFYEMLTHKLPFEDDLDGRDPKSILPGWLAQGERPDLPPIGPEEFKQIIQECWVQDPTKRLLAEQVVARLEPIVHSMMHVPEQPTNSAPQYQMFSIGSSAPGLSGIGSSPQYQMLSDDAARREMEARRKAEEEAKAKQQEIDRLKAELEKQKQDKERQARLAAEEEKKAEMLKQKQLEEQRRKEEEAKAAAAKKAKEEAIKKASEPLIKEETTARQFFTRVIERNSTLLTQMRQYLTTEVPKLRKQRVYVEEQERIARKTLGEKLEQKRTGLLTQMRQYLTTEVPKLRKQRVYVEEQERIARKTIEEKLEQKRTDLLTQMRQYLTTEVPKLRKQRVYVEEQERIARKTIEEKLEQKRTDLLTQINQVTAEKLSVLAEEAKIKHESITLADQVTTFLTHVVTSAMPQAESMLQQNPRLALLSGTVTDHCGRVFKDITSFQLALWCLDVNMWTMILKYLPRKESVKQAYNYMKSSWVKSYGRSVNLKALQFAYNELQEDWKLNTGCCDFSSPWEQRQKHLLNVGSAQRQCSYAILLEYCQSDTLETSNFNSSRIFSYELPFSAKELSNLGSNSYIYRGNLGHAKIGDLGFISSLKNVKHDKLQATGVVADSKGINVLMKRIQEQEEIIRHYITVLQIKEPIDDLNPRVVINQPQANMLDPNLAFLTVNKTIDLVDDLNPKVVVNQPQANMLDPNLAFLTVNKTIDLVDDLNPKVVVTQPQANILDPTLAFLTGKRIIDPIDAEEEAIRQEAARKEAIRQEAARQVLKLLTHVIAGQQDEAEAMLKQNPALALIPGTVTDHANRTFQGTAFQCAVASLDWFMWEMILKYIPREEASNQIRGIENHPYAKAILTNWQQMLQDYDTYIKNYDSWDYDKCKDFWVHSIGKWQHDSPYHVFQEFCNPAQPFDPTPDFKDKYALERQLPEWAVISKVGTEFSFYRGVGRRGAQGRGDPVREWGATGWREQCVGATRLERADWNSLSSLLESRTSQRVDLVSDLLKSVSHPVLK